MCVPAGGLLLGALLLGALGAGCVGMGPGLSPGLIGPSRMPLEAFVSTRVDSTGADHPEVRVAVPHRSLIFRHEDGVYLAEIQVTAVARMDGRRVGGGVGRATARVEGYAATRGPGKLRCRVPLQVRGEGPVELEVAVEVRETSRVWERKFVYRPQAARSVPLYFSTFDWNLDAPGREGQVLGVGLDSLRVTVGMQRRPGGSDWPSGGLELVARI